MQESTRGYGGERPEWPVSCSSCFRPHSMSVSPHPPLQQRAQLGPSNGSPLASTLRGRKALGGALAFTGPTCSWEGNLGIISQHGKGGVGGDRPPGTLRALPPALSRSSWQSFLLFLGQCQGREGVTGLMPSAQLVFGGQERVFALPEHPHVPDENVFLSLAAKAPGLTTDGTCHPPSTPTRPHTASGHKCLCGGRGLSDTS